MDKQPKVDWLAETGAAVAIKGGDESSSPTRRDVRSPTPRVQLVR